MNIGSTNSNDFHSVNIFDILTDELSDTLNDHDDVVKGFNQNGKDVSSVCIHESFVSKIVSQPINVNYNKKRVQKHKRHRRSKKNKARNSKDKVDIKIAFNNVNRVKSSMYEIPKFVRDNNVDVFGIAETFLKHDEKVNVNGYKWIGKNRTSKGGGGIGFLIKDFIEIVNDDVFDTSSDDFERMWVKLNIGTSTCIYVACAYFPGEGTDPHLTDELYNQLLSEIIKIQDVDESEDPHIILMGDFNARIGNHINFGDPVLNSNGRKLINFRDDSDMTIVNCTRKCFGKITWFRHPYSSTIDYFLVSDSVYQCTNDMIVDEDRNFNIGSDHNMLFINITLDINPVKHVTRQVDNNRLTWNIKKDHDYSDYKNEINIQFKEWNADSFQDTNSLWSSWKAKLLLAANNSIGVKTHNGKNKQWWDKTIDEAIKERRLSCKSHRRWASSGSNNRDEGDALWKDYIDKKARVKHLVKSKITQMKIDRSIKIAKDGGPSSRDFWQTLKGPKTQKNQVYALKIPNTDNITSDRKIMNQTVRQYFHSLGKMNKCLYKDDFTDDMKNHVVFLRESSFYCDKVNNGDTLNNINITIDNVTKAINEAKNNKSPGLDSITNELLKNGGDALNDSLLKLFRRLVILKGTPTEWNQGIIIPIFKKGDKKDLNNYRGITLTSCVSKIFNRIVCKEISNFLEDQNILSEVQGGFRKDHRCEDHIFTLKSIITTRQADNKPTFLAFLDFRKAFDTVWRDGLLSIAWKLGIRGSAWNLLDSLYTNVQAKVSFGDIDTDLFDIDDGVKQGCVLSPILFNAYINELAKMFKECNTGVNICDVQIGCLFWADDVVLIAKDEKELQKMLDIASSFSRIWGLGFNYDKSNVMIVGKHSSKNQIWKLGESVISSCNSYKYLGVHISNNLSDHTHVSEVVKKGNRLIGYIKSILDGQDDVNRVFYGDVLWRTLALPCINYACAVWTCNNADIKSLENLQSQMARFILKAPRNTPIAALNGELGWQSISSMQDYIRVNYFARVNSMEMNRWPKLLFNTLQSIDCDIDQLRFKWLSSVRCALEKCNLGHVFKYDSMASPQWAKSCFKNLNRQAYERVWYENANSKSSLNDYVMFKTKLGMEDYLLDISDFLGVSLKFKARSNTLPVNGRVHSWKTGMNDTCPLCNNGREDLRHFLFMCSTLNDIRVSELSKLESSLLSQGLINHWQTFMTGDLDLKMCFMLGAPWDQKDCDIYFDKFCKNFLKCAWSLRSSITKDAL